MDQPQELLFGGAIGGFAQSIEGRGSSRNPVWYQVMEQAYFQLTSTDEGRAQYGDPEKGASLEQAWRWAMAISGIPNVVLLAAGRPTVPTEAIPRVLTMAPEQLVDTLSRAFGLQRPLAFETFVFDGRMGHCVVLYDYRPETSSFIFHDPWPGRSLLCAENNAAGVAAEPAEEASWQITSAELGRVIFGVFVLSPIWADLTGVDYRINLSTLKETDFWSFFHLRELGRRPWEEQEELQLPRVDHTVVSIEPGGFKEEIRLQVSVDEAERVVGGDLWLRRGWVTGAPWGINPLAIDLAKSFIDALTPVPDEDDVAPLVNSLADLNDPERMQAIFQQRSISPTVIQLLLTYLGELPESNSLLELCRVSADNVDLEGEPWLKLSVLVY